MQMVKLNEVSTIPDEDMPTIGLTCRCMEDVNLKVLAVKTIFRFLVVKFILEPKFSLPLSSMTHGMHNSLKSTLTASAGYAFVFTP